MKLLVVLALVAMAMARPDEETYDSKYDNFNADELVENDRLLRAYSQCFLGEGKCTPEGTDIKKWIPEASSSSCAKCTEKQKVLVAKVIKALQSKLPAEYEKLNAKNDPEGKYQEDIKNFVAKYGD